MVNAWIAVAVIVLSLSAFVTVSYASIAILLVPLASLLGPFLAVALSSLPRTQEAASWPWMTPGAIALVVLPWTPFMGWMGVLLALCLGAAWQGSAARALRAMGWSDEDGRRRVGSTTLPLVASHVLAATYVALNPLGS